MSYYDEQYQALVHSIVDKGFWDKDQNVRTRWLDGTQAHAKSLFGLQMEFDALPISTTKKLAWKTAIKEMLLFWVKQSNKKSDFHELNCHVWDEWFLDDGTIGRSYPYQFESRPKKEVVFVKRKEQHGYKNSNITLETDYGMIKNFTQEQIDSLYSKWQYMLVSCFEENSLTKVSDEWMSFGTYLNDVRDIPQWHLAKEDLDNWDVDKDYYMSNLYSKETCVWLSKQDAETYREYSKPFMVYKPNGESELALNVVNVALKYGLVTSSIMTVLNGRADVKHYNGFRFEYVPLKEGYVCRYKLSKNQVVDVLNNIKNTPSSRRLMTSFWNDADVDEKALQECAYETIWNVENDTLNLILGQRSLDVGLGCCFNQFQYYVLLSMVAQVSGLKVGRLIHQIGSAHIYERHIDPLMEQVSRVPYEAPKLWINPEVKHFNNFTIDDFDLIGYEHHPSIKMEVAI